MGNWSQEQLEKIDTKLAGVNEKDIRFFRIEEFKRNIKRVDAFSSNCSSCRRFQLEIEEAVANIEEAVKSLGKKRRAYDRLISKLAKHMQKEHGFYAPYYFTYLISFAGMVAGSILGYFLMQLNPSLKIELFCVGFALGLLPTYVWGHLKDKKIRQEKRLM